MLKWIIEKRKILRMSQFKVASEAGISQSYYAAIENGVRNPSVDTAKHIAAVLGFEWTRFFTDTDDTAPAVEAEAS